MVRFDTHTWSISVQPLTPPSPGHQSNTDTNYFKCGQTWEGMHALCAIERCGDATVAFLRPPVLVGRFARVTEAPSSSKTSMRTCHVCLQNATRLHGVACRHRRQLKACNSARDELVTRASDCVPSAAFLDSNSLSLQQRLPLGSAAPANNHPPGRGASTPTAIGPTPMHPPTG